MNESIEPHIRTIYEIDKKLGTGAYGIVYRVLRLSDGKQLALKKIFDAFRNSTDAQRTYREIMYLKCLTKHENIINLHDVHSSANKRDIYVSFELMESDLHTVSRSKSLTNSQKRVLMYQIFKALKFIHSAELVHRDIKPSNILIDSECNVKLADFGLVRSISEREDNINRLMSENVATRWYRAPEIITGSRQYSKEVDLWATGCVMAELLTGKVLFRGKSPLNQLELMVGLIGKPTDLDIKEMKTTNYAEFLRSAFSEKTRNFDKLFCDCEPEAVDLLKDLLKFNPSERLTAQESLEHPYFKQIRKIREEKVCPSEPLLPLPDDTKLNPDVYRNALYKLSQPLNSDTAFCKRIMSLPKIGTNIRTIKDNHKDQVALQTSKLKTHKASSLAKKLVKHTSTSVLKEIPLMSPSNDMSNNIFLNNNFKMGNLKNPQFPRNFVSGFGKLFPKSELRINCIGDISNIENSGKNNLLKKGKQEIKGEHPEYQRYQLFGASNCFAKNNKIINKRRLVPLN